MSEDGWFVFWVLGCFAALFLYLAKHKIEEDDVLIDVPKSIQCTCVLQESVRKRLVAKMRRD